MGSLNGGWRVVIQGYNAGWRVVIQGYNANCFTKLSRSPLFQFLSFFFKRLGLFVFSGNEGTYCRTFKCLISSNNSQEYFAIDVFLDCISSGCFVDFFSEVSLLRCSPSLLRLLPLRDSVKNIVFLS